jgi:hypothetical protein
MDEWKGWMILRNQLIVWVIRQYGTGLYRAWVSLDRGNTICLCGRQDEASAAELINRFLESCQEGRIKTLEDILAFINSICVKDLTEPLHLIQQNVDEMAA